MARLKTFVVFVLVIHFIVADKAAALAGGTAIAVHAKKLNASLSLEVTQSVEYFELVYKKFQLGTFLTNAAISSHTISTMVVAGQLFDFRLGVPKSGVKHVRATHFAPFAIEVMGKAAAAFDSSDTNLVRIRNHMDAVKDEMSIVTRILSRNDAEQIKTLLPDRLEAIAHRSRLCSTAAEEALAAFVGVTDTIVEGFESILRSDAATDDQKQTADIDIKLLHEEIANETKTLDEIQLQVKKYANDSEARKKKMNDAAEGMPDVLQTFLRGFFRLFRKKDAEISIWLPDYDKMNPCGEMNTLETDSNILGSVVEFSEMLQALIESINQHDANTSLRLVKDKLGATSFETHVTSVKKLVERHANVSSAQAKAEAANMTKDWETLLGLMKSVVQVVSNFTDMSGFETFQGSLQLYQATLDTAVKGYSAKYQDGKGLPASLPMKKIVFGRDNEDSVYYINQLMRKSLDFYAQKAHCLLKILEEKMLFDNAALESLNHTQANIAYAKNATNRAARLCAKLTNSWRRMNVAFSIMTTIVSITIREDFDDFEKYLGAAAKIGAEDFDAVYDLLKYEIESNAKKVLGHAEALSIIARDSVEIGRLYVLPNLRNYARLIAPKTDIDADMLMKTLEEESVSAGLEIGERCNKTMKEISSKVEDSIKDLSVALDINGEHRAKEKADLNDVNNSSSKLVAAYRAVEGIDAESSSKEAAVVELAVWNNVNNVLTSSNWQQLFAAIPTAIFTLAQAVTLANETVPLLDEESEREGSGKKFSYLIPELTKLSCRMWKALYDADSSMDIVYWTTRRISGNVETFLRIYKSNNAKFLMQLAHLPLESIKRYISQSTAAIGNISERLDAAHDELAGTQRRILEALNVYKGELKDTENEIDILANRSRSSGAILDTVRGHLKRRNEETDSSIAALDRALDKIPVDWDYTAQEGVRSLVQIAVIVLGGILGHVPGLILGGFIAAAVGGAFDETEKASTSTQTEPDDPDPETQYLSPSNATIVFVTAMLSQAVSGSLAKFRNASGHLPRREVDQYLLSISTIAYVSMDTLSKLDRSVERDTAVSYLNQSLAVVDKFFSKFPPPKRSNNSKSGGTTAATAWTTSAQTSRRNLDNSSTTALLTSNAAFSVVTTTQPPTIGTTILGLTDIGLTGNTSDDNVTTTSVSTALTTTTPFIAAYAEEFMEALTTLGEIAAAAELKFDIWKVNLAQLPQDVIKPEHEKTTGSGAVLVAATQLKQAMSAQAREAEALYDLFQQSRKHNKLMRELAQQVEGSKRLKKYIVILSQTLSSMGNVRKAWDSVSWIFQSLEQLVSTAADDALELFRNYADKNRVQADIQQALSQNNTHAAFKIMLLANKQRSLLTQSMQIAAYSTALEIVSSVYLDASRTYFFQALETVVLAAVKDVTTSENAVATPAVDGMQKASVGIFKLCQVATLSIKESIGAQTRRINTVFNASGNVSFIPIDDILDLLPGKRGRNAMDDGNTTANESATLTKALDRLAASMVANKLTFSEVRWENMLLSTPMAIFVIRYLTVLSLNYSFPLGVPTKKHILLQHQDFAAAVAQVADAAQDAFIMADRNMFRISNLHMAKVPLLIQTVLKQIITAPADKVFEYVFPVVVEIRRKIDASIRLVQKTRDAFTTTMELVGELAEGVAGRMSETDERLTYIRQMMPALEAMLADQKQREEDLVKNRNFTAAELEAEKEKYDAAIEKIPTGWKSVGMEFVLNLGKALSLGINVAIKGTTVSLIEYLWKVVRKVVADNKPTSAPATAQEAPTRILDGAVGQLAAAVVKFLARAKQRFSGSSGEADIEAFAKFSGQLSELYSGSLPRYSKSKIFDNATALGTDLANFATFLSGKPDNSNLLAEITKLYNSATILQAAGMVLGSASRKAPVNSAGSKDGFSEIGQAEFLLAEMSRREVERLHERENNYHKHIVSEREKMSESRAKLMQLMYEKNKSEQANEAAVVAIAEIAYLQANWTCFLDALTDVANLIEFVVNIALTDLQSLVVAFNITSRLDETAAEEMRTITLMSLKQTLLENAQDVAINAQTFMALGNDYDQLSKRHVVFQMAAVSSIFSMSPEERVKFLEEAQLEAKAALEDITSSSQSGKQKLNATMTKTVKQIHDIFAIVDGIPAAQKQIASEAHAIYKHMGMGLPQAT